MLKKISFGQNKRYKKCPLFSFAGSNWSQCYFQLAIFIWAEQGSSLKLYVEFSIFDFFSFLLKFNSLLSKSMDSLNWKHDD